MRSFADVDVVCRHKVTLSPCIFFVREPFSESFAVVQRLLCNLEVTPTLNSLFANQLMSHSVLC